MRQKTMRENGETTSAACSICWETSTSYSRGKSKNGMETVTSLSICLRATWKRNHKRILGHAEVDSRDVAAVCAMNKNAVEK